jgi:Rrf2 family protein
MKLSTKGEYGTRLLLDVALHSHGEPIQLRDIARREKLSLWYLEHLVAPLVAGGIVRTTRGPKGGVSLAKPLEEIKLSDIIQQLEGSTAPIACIDDPKFCDRSGSCVTRDIWGEIQKATDNVLESLTLQDLVERQKQKEEAKQPMYFI